MASLGYKYIATTHLHRPMLYAVWGYGGNVMVIHLYGYDLSPQICCSNMVICCSNIHVYPSPFTIDPYGIRYSSIVKRDGYICVLLKHITIETYGMWYGSMVKGCYIHSSLNLPVEFHSKTVLLHTKNNARHIITIPKKLH